MMAWEPEQRRTSSYVVLGVALALVLAGVAVWYFVAGTPEWVYWAMVGALALVLAFMVVLLVAKPRAAAVAEAAPAQAEAAPAPVAEAPAATAFQPRILTLRCGDCGTIFDVTDTGERPLYHTCPGCGAEGALRDPVETPAAAPAEAAPAPAPAPAPSMAYAPPPEYSAPPAEPAPAAAASAAPAPAAVKKLKLRCGGCKEVFSIEDTGERPLKRACPHCGRIGKIG